MRRDAKEARHMGSTTDIDLSIIDNTGGDGQFYTVTPGLRFVERVVPVRGVEPSVGTVIRVLQQMWQGSNGTQRWEDVPLVRE